jgi:hypothetical protein
MFKNLTSSSGASGYPEFTIATLPDAASATWAGRTIVCTDLADGRQMRSKNGRWVPIAPFTVDQNTRSDVVTGAIAESLMHSVNISNAVRFMGPKGRLKIAACWSCTSSANAKNIRIRVGKTVGASWTAIFDSTVAGVSGLVAEKVMYARGSESLQGSSAAAVPANGAFGFPLAHTSLNFAPGGDDIYVSFLAAPVGAGETCTLNWYSIVIEPGF